MRLNDRIDAGRRLASRLKQYAGLGDLVVLGLPRGGVPVAFAIAEQLGAGLDAFVVRKVGVPGHEELAMGAVASGGVTVRNETIIERLGVSPDVFEASAEAQRLEVDRREKRYRKGRPAWKVRGRNVILTDDGLATGATMKAAVEAIRKNHPRRLIVAVPVAARVSVDAFRQRLESPSEEFVCLHEPEVLDGLSGWYADFRQIRDDEVKELLQTAPIQRCTERSAKRAEKCSRG